MSDSGLPAQKFGVLEENKSDKVRKSSFRRSTRSNLHVIPPETEVMEDYDRNVVDNVDEEDIGFDDEKTKLECGRAQKT